MERSLKRRQRSSAAPGGGPYSRTTLPQPRLLALEAHHAARRRGGHGTPRSACRSLPGFKGRTSGCRGGISGACELRTTRHGSALPPCHMREGNWGRGAASVWAQRCRYGTEGGWERPPARRGYFPARYPHPSNPTEFVDYTKYN